MCLRTLPGKLDYRCDMPCKPQSPNSHPVHPVSLVEICKHCLSSGLACQLQDQNHVMQYTI